MTNAPFAYAAVAMDASESTYVTNSREQAEAACREYGWQLVPLYAGLRLTDAERALLVMLADHPNTHDLFPEDAQTIRGLLDRLSPITQAESDRPKPIATPPTQPTPGECSKPREGT